MDSQKNLTVRLLACRKCRERTREGSGNSRGAWLGFLAPRNRRDSQSRNQCPAGGSAELLRQKVAGEQLLSGKSFGRITLRKFLLRSYSRGGGSAELLSGSRKVVRGTHSRGGGSAEYSAEGRSGKLLSGRWFGRTTLRKVVRGKYSREGVPAELLFIVFLWFFAFLRWGTLRGRIHPPRTPRGALRIRTEYERFSSAPSASEEQRFRSTERASEAQISLLVPCGGEKQKLLQRLRFPDST